MHAIKIKPKIVPGTQKLFEYFAYAIETGPLVQMIHLYYRKKIKPKEINEVLMHSFLLADVPDWIRVLLSKKNKMLKNSTRVKQGNLELNGLANIHGLLYVHEDDLPEKFKVDLKEQLDLLERYIIALGSEQGAPLWHELKANRERYPKRSKL